MLESRRLLVKERVKLLSAVQSYDLYDPDSERPDDPVGVAEEKIGPLTRLLRMVANGARQMLPTRVEVREKPDDALVFAITRGFFLLRPRVEVLDAQGQVIGYFKAKMFSIGGGFHVYTADDTHLAEVKGNFVGFQYRMVTPGGETELGSVSKQFKLMKEMFTSADTYMLETSEDLRGNPIAKMLVIASALAIDVVYKSGK